MLGPVLGAWTFWLCVLASLGVTCTIFFTVAHYWENNLEKKRSGLTLNGEALRSPIATGITVAGIILPLNVSLISYSVVKLRQPIDSLAVLFASVVILTLAVCVGVWNAYSIATVTGKDGEIFIDKKRLTYLPGQFVSQLVMLLAGVLLLALYGVFFFPPVSGPGSATAPLVPILRPVVSVGITADQLVQQWGPASKQQHLPDGYEYHYESPTSEYSLLVKEGLVVRLTETLKENK